MSDLRPFDVVRTSDGLLAMVKEVSRTPPIEASLMYFKPTPPNIKYAWWGKHELEVLFNLGDLMDAGGV